MAKIPHAASTCDYKLSKGHCKIAIPKQSEKIEK
jgi:hypothetical protein